MQNTIVHHEGAASLEAVATKVKPRGARIKIGLDVHARLYVAVAQYDHLLPKAARRLKPNEFMPWVETLLGQGHSVHVVYEACGFGFTLYRQLIAAGAHCYVIAPRKLDEERSRVKTDPRDATTLCQRLSRYLEGNTRELAVIRVPTEEEERARHVSRQRTQLVCHRQKLEAQGRSLLISHALPAPAHWWKEQTFSRLGKHLPAWMKARLQTARPALLSLQEQIESLTSQLEASAPSNLPRGLGKLTSVVLTREICDWHRFNNRRAISSYTGLCPGERSSGSKRVPGSVTKRGNPRVRAALVECAWRMVRFQPHYPPVQKRLAILAKGSRALGSVRKKAIVALARRLAVDLWRLHTGRCTAEQLGLSI
ncbi:MAG TPA: IS110 family transposase [Candidatus Sulfotelmatobacter sp.]|jgi:transposase|nr:IS110 family transposase [Candidatus Sulfotelmatobacter sp.]